MQGWVTFTVTVHKTDDVVIDVVDVGVVVDVVVGIVDVDDVVDDYVVVCVVVYGVDVVDVAIVVVVVNCSRTDVVTVAPWLAPVVWEGTFNPVLLDSIYKPKNITVAATVFAVGK